MEIISAFARDAFSALFQIMTKSKEKQKAGFSLKLVVEFHSCAHATYFRFFFVIFSTFINHLQAHTIWNIKGFDKETQLSYPFVCSCFQCFKRDYINQSLKRRISRERLLV